MRRVWIASIFCLIALLAISPLTSHFVHSQALIPPIAASFVTVSLIPWSSIIGVFQGLTEFTAFAVLTFMQAAFRITAAMTLFWTKSVTVLLVATAVATLVPLIIATQYLNRRIAGIQNHRVSPGPVALNSPIVHNAVALTVLTVLTVGFPTVGDVVIVRHVYDPERAGLYAGIALVGRCVLFTSVAINSVLYPRYIKAKQCRDRQLLLRQGLVATVVLSGGVALCLGIVPHLSLHILVGAQYQSISYLLRPYLLSCLAVALASNFAYYQLAAHRVAAVVGVLMPCLLVQLLLPFLIPNDLSSLMLAEVGVSVGMLAASAVISIKTEPKYV